MGTLRNCLGKDKVLKAMRGFEEKMFTGAGKLHHRHGMAYKCLFVLPDATEKVVKMFKAMEYDGSGLEAKGSWHLSSGRVCFFSLALP